MVRCGARVFGIAAVYWYFIRQATHIGESRWDAFLSTSLSAASVGIAACTAVGLLIGGGALVELYAQRVDLSIIEADDNGDIE